MSRIYTPVGDIKEIKYGAVRRSAAENEGVIKKAFAGAFDIVTRTVELNGLQLVFAYCDGLCDSWLLTSSVIKPIIDACDVLPDTGTADYIEHSVVTSVEISRGNDLDEAIEKLLTGNLLLFINGEADVLLFGVQKLPSRGIEEPDSEVSEKGAREGFTENFKQNLSLVRKRLTTASLRVENSTVGITGKTRIALCYLEGRVPEKTLAEVKQRLADIKIDAVFGADYLGGFLDTRRKTLFSMVHVTQRPDVFCAKLTEGKVCILVDGTPFALVLPFLFVENFHNMDDYLNKPYFATLMRIIRLLSFGISILLPGMYVAVALFHQEMLPDDMLYSIAMSESNTMFPLMLEALVIHFIYEIVREAGLRIPKSVGHAVSIVGALVIGDAAVTGGLIGAPMLIIVAMTAISSFVVSGVYQAVSVLRLAFIIVGGLSGLYGIMIGLAVLIINMCSVTDYGVSYLAPLTPYDKSLLRDTFSRASMKKLAKKVFNVEGFASQE